MELFPAWQSLWRKKSVWRVGWILVYSSPFIPIGQGLEKTELLVLIGRPQLYIDLRKPQ